MENWKEDVKKWMDNFDSIYRSECIPDIRLYLVDARRFIKEFEDEVAGLKKIRDIDDDLVRKKQVIFYKDVPYCPSCWGRDRQLIPVHLKMNTKGRMFYICFEKDCGGNKGYFF